ncbi:MAG: murein biosynthesis integral membrane protein MurJ [bacterium]|nr:murein biosynthesis integral membrane protein MurJ [bacterium]
MQGLPMSVAILSASSLLSAVLGLLRDRLLVSHFGAGHVLDAYFAAFRVPDFLYAVLIMGGMNSVLLPMISRRFHEEHEEAWKFVSNLLNTLFVCVAVFALILFVGAPLLIGLITPGFSLETKDLTVSLTRLMLLSPILFSLSAVFSSILQYFHRTLAFALAPILYNLGIIGGIVFLVPIFGIWGVALGVVGGAFLHFFSQACVAFTVGFRWKSILSFKDRNLYEMFVLAIPRTIGGGLYQLNLVVVTALASTLGAGSLVIFNLANNIQYLPAGIAGVSFALASFPAFSTIAARGDRKEFRAFFMKAFRATVITVLPLAIFLFFFREEIVRILFQAGKFQEEDAGLVASLLGVFSLGILFQALIPFISRAFFALSDTKTPTVIGGAAIVLNVALAIFLMQNTSLGVVSLATSLTVSAIFQCVLLLFALNAKFSSTHE